MATYPGPEISGAAAVVPRPVETLASVYDYRDEEAVLAYLPEADLRTAISRADYATFHAASAFVRANRLVPDAERLTHDDVWPVIVPIPML